MDPYRSHPPPSLSGYPLYMGTPHHSSFGPYQAPSAAPYPMPNDYNSFHLPQMYMPHSSYPPYGDMDSHYRQQLLDDEPSCFDSLLESICCCFGFGPQNHHEEMYRHELQRRRLIAKEERNIISRHKKEKQKLMQFQQEQMAKHSSSISKPSPAQTAAATVAEATV